MVLLYGKEIELTPLEFAILLYLANNIGNVVSSEELFEKVWKEKYLDNNSGYSFFKSTGSTILKTTAGMLCSPISVMDAFAGIIVGAKKFLDVKSIRWQGFVMDSRNIINKIER